jgi:hypothetical protein
MLRLSWIHDVFDLAAVCRDAVYSFGGGTPSQSWVQAVISGPSPPLSSHYKLQYILPLFVLAIDVVEALCGKRFGVSRKPR